MNIDTYMIAIGQFFDLGTIGLLFVFLTPMIFGGITFWYSWKSTDEVTKEWWKKYK